MNHLPEICSIISDPGLRAYGITTTLAAVGDKIQESLLSIYIAPVEKDCDLYPTLSAFMGMDILSVVCDCYPFANKFTCLYHILINMSEFEVGIRHKHNLTAEYIEATEFVEGLKNKL